MPFIRITKIFTFESAHLLTHHTGLCRNIHGHSYILHVCIGGHISEKSGTPLEGMVWDFGDLKRLVQQTVLEELDHALMINTKSSNPILEKSSPFHLKIIRLPFEPTSENLVWYIAEKIKKGLPPPYQLMSVRIYETATSYADWLASDNINDPEKQEE